MQGKVTLKEIIESIFSDVDTDNLTEGEYNQYDDDREKYTRKLYRKFERLLERLGSDKEILKAGGRTMEFNEAEVPFMKVLLTQLLDNESIIAKFTNDATASKKFSSSDIHDLIQSLIDEADKAGMSERELIDLAKFLESIFLCSHLRSIERCHMLIDGLALNLQDLPSSVQAAYLGKVEHILDKEYALRIAESAFRIRDLAELVSSNEFDVQFYYEHDPEIRFEYMQRDREVLERIQEDDDLRKYIEKVFQRKAEEIFNYVELQ